MGELLLRGTLYVIQLLPLGKEFVDLLAMGAKRIPGVQEDFGPPKDAARLSSRPGPQYAPRSWTLNTPAQTQRVPVAVTAVERSRNARTLIANASTYTTPSNATSQSMNDVVEQVLHAASVNQWHPRGGTERAELRSLLNLAEILDLTTQVRTGSGPSLSAILFPRNYYAAVRSRDMLYGRGVLPDIVDANGVPFLRNIAAMGLNGDHFSVNASGRFVVDNIGAAAVAATRMGLLALAIRGMDYTLPAITDLHADTDSRVRLHNAEQAVARYQYFIVDHVLAPQPDLGTTR